VNCAPEGVVGAQPLLQSGDTPADLGLGDGQHAARGSESAMGNDLDGTVIVVEVVQDAFLAFLRSS
jgi:hypothetical protein